MFARIFYSKLVLITLITTRIRIIEGVCYTAWGTPGRCVNIWKCDPILRILRPRPISDPVLRILQQSQCGFEGLDPKVCCQTGYDVEDVHPTTYSNNPTTKKNEVEDKDQKEEESSSSDIYPPNLIFSHRNKHLLDHKQCGPIPEGRIYGGNVTSVFEFPWMALLGYKTDSSGAIEFRCGGSLINKRYVLTAAHCTAELPTGLILTTVRVGEHDLDRDRDCDEWEKDGRVGINCAEKYQDFGVERVEVHPEFTRRKLQNDISLVRMDSEVDFRPVSVRPICLPLGRAAVQKLRKVVVTGWGSTEFGRRSQRLLKVALPIVNIEKCRKAYRYQTINIWHKQICAGGTNGKDSCSGDSGGPLQTVSIYEAQHRYVLYGIVSYGPHSCGIEGYPGVYTNVAYYLDWIMDTITE